MKSKQATEILVVGSGNMGSAMLQQLLQAKQNWRFQVVEPDRERHAAVSNPAVRLYSEVSELPRQLSPAAIIFMVKPQVMVKVVAEYRHFAPNSLFISIAAGFRIQQIQQALAPPAAVNIVRVMPNLPAAIGCGALVACSNRPLPAPARALSNALLQCCGSVHWLAESDMDAVTALSGSGPAYVFYFLEALILAGTNCGLDRDTATQLAYETVLGSCKLAQDSGSSPAELRAAVTSKGGTTAAALAVLQQDDKFIDLMVQAVSAAYRRSKVLGD